MNFISYFNFKKQTPFILITWCTNVCSLVKATIRFKSYCEFILIFRRLSLHIITNFAFKFHSLNIHDCNWFCISYFFFAVTTHKVRLQILDDLLGNETCLDVECTSLRSHARHFLPSLRTTLAVFIQMMSTLSQKVIYIEVVFVMFRSL